MQIPFDLIIKFFAGLLLFQYWLKKSETSP